jgi:hypothetical protein
VEPERHRLMAKYHGALARLARTAEPHDPQAAVQWWKKLAAADPLSGAVAASLMRVLAAAGDGRAALRHAQVYTALVEQELGTAPDPAIAQLAERIRSTAAQTAALTAASNGEGRNGIDRRGGTGRGRGLAFAALVPWAQLNPRTVNAVGLIRLLGASAGASPEREGRRHPLAAYVCDLHRGCLRMRCSLRPQDGHAMEHLAAVLRVARPPTLRT